MSESGQSAAAAQAAAEKMAAALGVENIDITQVANMLTLKHTLLPMFQVSIAFLILAWLAVSLRIYSRALVIRSFGIDDWLMLLTLAIFTSTCACLIAIEVIERNSSTKLALREGLIAEFVVLKTLYQLILGFMSLYVTCTVALKLALFFFYLRVIPSGWQRRALYIATGLYTAYGTFFTFVVIFQCGNPTQFFLQEARAKCIPSNVLQPLYYIAGGANAVTDWIFSLLPVTVIWNAAIPRSTKISAGCLLGLGSLGSISSLIRLAYIPGIKASPTFLSHAVNIASWSIVEPGLGIVAASLATLRPLFRHCFPPKRSTVLPTTHRGKTIAYQPGTYASRLSFEDKINPYGAVHWGSVTTVVGNARKHEVTELQAWSKKGPATSLNSIRESPVHSRDPSAVSRVDSGTALERSTSQRSLMRHNRLQFPWPPRGGTKKAFISNGRVIMTTTDVRLDEEVSVDSPTVASPV